VKLIFSVIVVLFTSCSPKSSERDKIIERMDNILKERKKISESLDTLMPALIRKIYIKEDTSTLNATIIYLDKRFSDLTSEFDSLGLRAKSEK
jgi:hypothetical protein